MVGLSLILNIVTLIYSALHIPETPYFLYYSHKCDDFYDCLARIRRVNNTDDPQLDTLKLWNLHP